MLIRFAEFILLIQMITTIYSKRLLSNFGNLILSSRENQSFRLGCIELHSILLLPFIEEKKTIVTQEISDYVFSIKENNDREELDEKIKELYKTFYQLSDINKAMILIYLDEKSYEEIPEHLGITQNNARIKMMRAKDQLKQL